jgi:hypothetical protein
MTLARIRLRYPAPFPPVSAGGQVHVDGGAADFRAATDGIELPLANTEECP